MNPATQTGHISDWKVTYQNLTRWQRFKAHAWGTLASHTEAQWLKANGWTCVGPNQWLLPLWHPHKERASCPSRGHSRFDHSSVDGERRSRKIAEPYDQNHAANSQRKYFRAEHICPATGQISSTARYSRFVYISHWLHGVGLACAAYGGGAYGRAGSLGWRPGLFFLAAALCLCLSWLSFFKSRREFELDLVERRLGRQGS